MASYYQCQRCGNCCRWPGTVRVSAEETDAIAAHLRLAPDEFISRYTELLPDRRGLTLRSTPDGACIFLEGKNHCAIQGAKPRQCSGFPNTWNFPGWRDVCEATEIADAAL
ncbi:MAG: YkgJ family cysteine cluster protein [Verrucomicrobium sp.]|nr:YkgJ family cysteine cluster protein [Verrucomicrobium sp.]